MPPGAPSAAPVVLEEPLAEVVEPVTEDWSRESWRRSKELFLNITSWRGVWILVYSSVGEERKESEPKG